MKRPSEKTIARAVTRWVKAEIRWMEIALAEPGEPTYVRISADLPARKRERYAAKAKLLNVGMKMLATKKKVPHA